MSDGNQPAVQAAKPRVLWLCGSDIKSTDKVYGAYGRVMRGHGVEVQWTKLGATGRFDMRGKQRKADQAFNAQQHNLYLEALRKTIQDNNISVVVVNCQHDLELLIDNPSIHKYAGHVFHRWGIPFVVCNSLRTATYHEPTQFSVSSVLMKVLRLAKGVPVLQPKFKYFVPKTLDQWRTYADVCDQAVTIAIDIETTGGRPGMITCVGFTALMPSGKLLSCVLPTFSHFHHNGNYFETQEESEEAWRILQRICGNKAPKAFANGMYDLQHLLVAGVIVNNYLVDSVYLQHSYLVETSKSLVYTSSCYLDDHYYWKDQISGDIAMPEDAVISVPSTERGQEMYWRYCALDCHNTMMVIVEQMKRYRGAKYAVNNYAKIFFPLIVGPALMMNLGGFEVDGRAESVMRREAQDNAKRLLQEFRDLIDDQKFNPNSPKQITTLIYDHLKGDPVQLQYKQVKEKTKANTLALIAEQNYVLEAVINKLLEYRFWAKRETSFNEKHLFLGRLFYNNSPVGTDTSRFSSSQSVFWCGHNIQNVTKGIRHKMIPDSGYMLFDADYSNSDTWFVAHDAEDEDLIRILNAGEDNHCHNASLFFQKPYEEILADHKAGESTLRQLSKKLGHAMNYMMGTDTMFLDMGSKNVVTTLKAVGRYRPSMDYKAMASGLGIMKTRYFENKKRLKEWQKEAVAAAIRGNCLVEFWGGFTRQFMLDVNQRNEKQRQIVATVGQAGTGMNTNRMLLRLYYGTDLTKQGVWISTQTHDNVVCQVPLAKPQLVDELIKVMNHPCTVKGRTFTVPIEVEVGLRWGKGLIGYPTEGGDISVDAMKQASNEACGYPT